VANNSNTPTLKQKLFAQKYIEKKGNGAQAALEVYDVSPKTAKDVAYQNLQKPVVQEEIRKELDKAGLTVNYLNSKSKKVIDLVDKVDPKTIGVATNHLQFVYKLHNVLPAKKSMHMSMSLRDQLPSKDFDEVKEQLQKLTDTTNALLEEVKG
jgi:phage terminase small subunit